jgi:predicted ATPase with chaperone activity
VPEGATPKDGPSAGIAMATAIVSVLTGIPVRKDVAMTGEITLRGRVLPIGGLKEKLLAALRGGVKTVLIPKENEKDLADIPENVKQGLEIIAVSTVDEVLKPKRSRQAADADRVDRRGRTRRDAPCRRWRGPRGSPALNRGGGTSFPHCNKARRRLRPGPFCF